MAASAPVRMRSGRPWGRTRPGVVRHLAALVAQFRDALLEQVEKRRYGHGARRELEEGEHLGDGFDDLGDRGRGDVVGGGVDERPGVEEGDPAAQDGGVVPVPGAQAPAGACGGAVEFDEPGEPGAVPARAHLVRSQLQGGGGPFTRLGGERARARRPVGRGPAGDPYGVGEDGPRLTGQLRGRRCALRRAGRRTCSSGGHGPSGRGQGSRADESESGVARQLLIRLSGRHGCSLPADCPKAQTEPPGRASGGRSHAREDTGPEGGRGVLRPPLYGGRVTLGPLGCGAT